MKQLHYLVLYFLAVCLFSLLFTGQSFGCLFRIQNNTDQKIYYHLYQVDHEVEELRHLPLTRAEGELRAFKHIDLGYAYPLVRYFIIWTDGRWNNEWMAKAEFDLTEVEVADDEMVVIELNWVPLKIEVITNGRNTHENNN